MNLSQLENLLIKKVRFNTENEFINSDSDEVVDGINVFYTFFDTLGKQLGIRNFGKLVLAKSKLATDGYNIDAEIPVSIRDKSPMDAVEKFIIQLDKASEAVDDAVSLNDIEELDDYAGKSPTPGYTHFSYAIYQFNHPSFAIKIMTGLDISSDTPNKGDISTTVKILY